ncbi:hypothetical protein PC9H_005873 [Pleurotus ostreatus]|uniref:Uncharacterized protein n=1 Tax=Pleurotus ostreatus TaxID=5322 RepID=A0A8H7DSH9_PLEOS|nr:uncharacterized protein PC9H_005873 [Pleurotus ostreatus]KAF7430173.1 hypothetical protein PC9H_005873 [Pleurotus ostreatus]KAJ8701235.1 hypothetical protein PTI98_000048 [Pleurotus ostreatus]
MALDSTPSKTQIMPIDLARPVISLAENISTSMSALYSLHAALYNVYEETSPEVLKFIDFKQKITSSWEQWATLLQQFMGFARDYVSVCHSLQLDTFVENVASANAILSSAQRIRREMANNQQAYEGLIQQFSSLATSFGREFSDASSGVNGATPGLQRLRLFQAAPHRGISEAYVASVRALNESNTPIRDISIFWEDLTTHLSKIARSSNLISKLNQELYFQRQISTWTSFHDTLIRVVESILSSCDASAVSPINQSHQWKKLLIRMRPKRRLSPGLPPSTQPNSMTPSGMSSVEAAESPQILMNPNKFDVQAITDTRSTVHACLHALLVRDTLRRNFRKGRFRVKERLLRQISAYFDSLPDLDEEAFSGVVTCQYVRKLLQAPEERSVVDEIRDSALLAADTTAATLLQYEGIYPILRAEISRKRTGKKADIILPKEFILHDLEGVPSRMLLTYTGVKLNQLIHQQQQFHMYWGHLAIDAERFDSVIDFDTKAVSDSWRTQEKHLRSYDDKARRAKELVTATHLSPSRHDWLPSFRGFSWKRRKTVDDVGAAASESNTQ